MPNATLPLQIDYVADHYHRYPGEELTFYLRLLPRRLLQFSVSISVYLPRQLLKVYQVTSKDQAGNWLNVDTITRLQVMSKDQAGNWLNANTMTGYERKKRIEYQIIEFTAKLSGGHYYEYQIKTNLSDGKKVSALKSDEAEFSQKGPLLSTWLELKPLAQAPVEILRNPSEVISIQILPQARSLKYLPGIYQDKRHEFLWRYLMIFDSYWELFENRLANLPAYFDPALAPRDFTSWLASWVGIVWDERLPESRRKALIPRIIQLYAIRGTKAGLKAYLGLCMDIAEDKIEVEESLAGNFVLGEHIVLSDNLIIGDPEGNACHFTVSMPASSQNFKPDIDFIKELIDAWKPAHTVYDLYTHTP